MSAIEQNATALGALRGADAASDASAASGAAATRTHRTRARLRTSGWWRLLSPLALLAVWQLTHVFARHLRRRGCHRRRSWRPPRGTSSSNPTPAFGSLQGALAGLARALCSRLRVRRHGGAAARARGRSQPHRRGHDRPARADDQDAAAVRPDPGLHRLVRDRAVAEGDPDRTGRSDPALPEHLLRDPLDRWTTLRARPGPRPHAAGSCCRTSCFQARCRRRWWGYARASGAAWLALVVAEQINASAGLGFMINQADAVPAERRDLRRADRLHAARAADRLDRPDARAPRPRLAHRSGDGVSVTSESRPADAPISPPAAPGRRRRDKSSGSRT